jgi:hypothetical protein
LSLLDELAARFLKRLDPQIGEAQENLTHRMPEADQAEQVGRLASYRHAREMFEDAVSSLAHDPDDDPEEDPPNPLLEDDE